MPKPGSTDKGSSSGSGQHQEQQWSHLVAGGVAGCSAVLLLHPFDVVKTRLQVQDGLPGALPAYRGTVDAVRTIVAREGVLGLYAGLAPSLLGSSEARQGRGGEGSGFTVGGTAAYERCLCKTQASRTTSGG
eukprot:GHRQ01016462.1.p1 GENE.GHRQ01016462.1~~GHRQ01016462.1.p1  ORF type:complete len:132 (+),score=46.77 GHRQ01016462.1:749-1144(+)